MATAYDDTFDLPDDVNTIKKKTRKPASKKEEAARLVKTLQEADSGGVHGRPGSMLNNLLALDTQECFTRSIAFTSENTLRNVQDQLNDVKQRLRQSVNQAMFRATSHDGRVLSMETNHTMTPSGKVYVQVIVTRTA